MFRLHQLLFLREGECRRVWPFLVLYALLFAAFALADGISVALFVTRIGAASLPNYYALTACANFVLIGGYVLGTERMGSARMFGVILGGSGVLYAGAWIAVRWFDGGDAWYGILFVGREIGYTLTLMHFGAYLQDYFTREQLDRALPVVYAGGRVGGIVGGWLLEHLSGRLGPVDVIAVFPILCLVCLIVVVAMSYRITAVFSVAQPDVPEESRPTQPEIAACGSVWAFLALVGRSPLLLCMTITSFLYMVVRWILNYQYNHFFGEYFQGSEALAEFLGRYTQGALLLSLALQLLLLGRLVAWVGVGGVYVGYAALIFLVTLLGLMPMSLALAVLCRFVETELRFGVRNPLMQLLANRFFKPLRVRVRAWIMGTLTPIATLASSVLLGMLAPMGSYFWISIAGVAVSTAHLLIAARLPVSARAHKT